MHETEAGPSRRTEHPDPLESSGSGRIPLPKLGGRLSPYVAELTDANFEIEVLGSELPVVVDFWAATCVPCRLQEETIGRLGQTLRGRVKVGRLDVYNNPDTPARFLVKGIPHLMVVHSGEVVLELVGGHSLEQLLSKLRRELELDF